MFIDAQADMEVVGEAASGPEAASGILATAPDVALMDLSMPGGGGLAAMVAVKQVRPKTRFLVLTAQDEAGFMRAAFDSGAMGFVVKTAAHTELLSAIRAVAQGRTFIDASIPLDRAHRSTRSSVDAGGASDALTQLTAREREVLRRVAEGYTNAQIAAELQLGLKSVETYRSRVMDKLGLDSRAGLVRFALDAGVLVPGRSRR